jgi:hypothetical protein
MWVRFWLWSIKGSQGRCANCSHTTEPCIEQFCKPFALALIIRYIFFLDIKLNKYDTWGEKCKAKFGSNQYLFHAIAKIIQDGLFITLQISVQKNRALMHILLFTLQLWAILPISYCRRACILWNIVNSR